MTELDELAAQNGVELSYVDAGGRHQTADPEVVHHILASLAAHPHTSRAPEGARLPVQRAFQGEEGKRHWLLAVQLYGVRSANNWGHGDFSDLAALVALASEVGAAGIGLNPLHALFADRPEQASPYSPNSRLFLNLLYIDVTAAPGFPGIGNLRLAKELRRLRNASLVDYRGVARAKIRGLRAAYQQFRKRPEQEDDFAAFRRERGRALQRFAAFETLRKKFNNVWWEWPQEWRRPDDCALETLRETENDAVVFEEYVQWVADRQLAACDALAAQRGLPIGLYIDLAVGVDPGGADGWSEQEAFLKDMSIGAPPDQLNVAGQDWGLTTFNPHYLRATNCGPFRELLAAAMRHAGAIRLDHVLGLNRMYLVPRGMSAGQGAYLRFPLDDLLAAVAEESLRYQCIVIGEDLGTVPEGFREKLAQYGIWTYVVMLFEREHDGAFRSGDRYPPNALATFATHDLATFAGWLAGHDLRVKRGINLDPGETERERERAREAMGAALADFHQDEFAAVVRHLAQSSSRLVAVAAEDIWSVPDQINIPGTVNEHPNWQRRLPVEITVMRTDQRLRAIADILLRPADTSLGA